METEFYYVVRSNSDLTEGRGYHISIALCESKSTAIRIGKGKYVQGLDCPVDEVAAIKLDGKWYVPLDAVRIEKATDADKQADAKAQAIKKARALGLDEVSIQLLIHG